MFCQQQQVLNQQLSIEQLLRAAKLIEQRAIIEKMPSSHFESYNNSSDKFGEKYESRILAPKLRTIVSDINIGQSSTGSSLRSSPLSVNSPSPDLAVLACLHSPQQQLTFIDQQQQRQSTSTSSASSSIASNCSMITTDAAQRLSSSLDDNLTPSVSHSAGRRCSGGSRQSRAAHNELEKNRRANLRGHLEALKSILPPENDTHRDTTLSLLTRARNYIRSIEEQKSELIKKREALLAEHQHLKNLLKQNNNEEKEIQQKYNENLTNERQNYEKEEEEEEKKLNFIQYEFNKQFCNNKKDEKFKEIKKTSPTIDEYLLFNGLIPSLPLLYPYSFNNNN